MKNASFFFSLRGAVYWHLACFISCFLLTSGWSSNKVSTIQSPSLHKTRCSSVPVNKDVKSYRLPSKSYIDSGQIASRFTTSLSFQLVPKAKMVIAIALSVVVLVRYISTTHFRDTFKKQHIVSGDMQSHLCRYVCKKCGYTIFPAKGRESKFFPNEFKCPHCFSDKDNFYDAASLNSTSTL